MLFKSISHIYSALILACFPPLALAQTLPAETTLPEVIVRARDESLSLTVPSINTARSEIDQTPGGVALVEAREYERGRAINLKDALDFAPGVYIQPRFGAEESRISIRGSGVQRTFHGRGIKLLQDNVPFNLADGSFDFQAIEPLSARYIEVFRGANALEFGSTTLGGAVNFISHSGYTANPIQARIGYGSFDTIHAQVSSGLVIGPFDCYMSLTQFSQNGYREHSRQNTQRLFANFGYRLAPEWETRFYVTYVQSNSELPGALTKTQLEDDPTEAQRNPGFLPTDVVVSNWKRDFELFRLANRTVYESGDNRVAITSFWSYKDLDHPILFWIDQLSNDFGVNLRYDNTAEILGHENHFIVGLNPTVGLVHDNRFANNRGDRGGDREPSPFGASAPADNEQTALNLDIYIQDSFYILPQWALVLGAQVTYASRDNEDNFPIRRGNPDNSSSQDWWGFSPKAGILCDITQNAQFFANVSRSFEPPTFGELVNAAGGGLVELEAQTATTVEVGTRGKSGRVSWDLAYYHAWLDNELLQFEVAPGLTQTVNAGSTVHQGIEAALTLDLLTGLLVPDNLAASPDEKGTTQGEEEMALDRLVLRQVYLWSDFYFDDDPTFGNNRLAGIPRHYYRAELLYEHPSGFYAGPNVEWVPQGYNVDFSETLYTDAYALLGLKIGYRSEHGFSVFFEAKNLTDEHYAATTNVIANARGIDSQQFFPGDGRSFFGGLEWRW